MLILHANWADSGLRLWAESLEQYVRVEPEGAPGGSGGAGEPSDHPFAVNGDELRSALQAEALVGAEHLDGADALELRLPSSDKAPMPSDRLASAAEALESGRPRSLRAFRVPSIGVRSDCAIDALLRLEDRGQGSAVQFGHEMPWWIATARFLLELLADQRFVPTLGQAPGPGPGAGAGARRGAEAGSVPGEAGLRAAWRPWLSDSAAQERVEALRAAMPPLLHAADPAPDADPWRLLHQTLDEWCDATVRRALEEDDYRTALEGRDPRSDHQVAWLTGLLGAPAPVHLDAGDGIQATVGAWIGRLQEAGRASTARLGFRLHEPPEDAASDADGATWWLSLRLLLHGEPPVVIEAARVWAASPTAGIVEGHRVEWPHELLLAELGRASRLYPRLEAALSHSRPAGVALNAAEAAAFLREFRPLLEESGFAVEVPGWWDEPGRRLGLRLVIDAPDAAAGGRLGLAALVSYRWQLAVGDEVLTPEQLRGLLGADGPMVRVGRRWIEIAPRDVEVAERVLDAEPGGEVTLLEALRMAQGGRGAGRGAGLPVVGLDSSGWVRDVLEATADSPHARLPSFEQPAEFRGVLRPYQLTGLRWLAFLEQFGLGACLADDMGLGKTIQLIALLLHERAPGAPGAPGTAPGSAPAPSAPGPTLLVAPTSVVANWARELSRFAPGLRVHVQHGPQRPLGAAFAERAAVSDVVITTYALVARDLETLMHVGWHRVALDEAQYVKNPPTKQTSAIRRLAAARRVALTGTPVENRLSELWSIMEFCNPGYLGGGEEFRRRWAVPIERHRDRRAAESLRGLVRPFILRRLKTDPDVISDLPECVETREYATLTAEQAQLYQAVVDELLDRVEAAEGIQRRGRVLAALVKLKQVCNHPAQFLAGTSPGEADPDHRGLSSRSGKCRRLIEMLEEVLAGGGKALLFTQFRRMGHLLAAMIRHDLDTEALFLHGATPTKRRQELIDRFQQDPAAPVFILSLRAGGLGLNLTAANHVFHFDRWWNPAVESQATDRAFRIGQTRTVQVHKFVCLGTLEEHIDRMLEEKTELASNIIGVGEQWITELSTQDLHDVLRLRSTAMELDP